MKVSESHFKAIILTWSFVVQIEFRIYKVERYIKE